VGLLHNELKSSPLARAIKKILAVSDSEGGLERFGETLTPVLDMWSLPEFEVPRGERGFSQSVNSPAVAARFSCIALTNPVGSQMLGVVNLVRNTGAGAIFFSTDTTIASSLLANLVTSSPRSLDLRPFQVGQAAVPAAQLLLQSGDTAAGVSRANHFLNGIGASGPPDSIDPRIVLPPGTAVFLFGGAVNATITAEIRWRERRVIGSDELV
jgi:hypothetical protein